MEDIISIFSFKYSLSSLRFGEALRIVMDELDSKNFYAVNPDYLPDLKK